MGPKVMKKKKERPGPGPGDRDQELSRLDGPTLGYFRRVGDTLEQGFEEEEEKGLFVTNVLEEVRGQELELCTNASVSPVLERLLEHCGTLELRRFLASVRHCRARLVRHCCGAHVLQTALLRAARLGRERLEEEGEEEGSLASLIQELSAEVREHFLECARHTHASFVLRTVLQVLGGAIPEAESTKGKAPRGLKCGTRVGKVKEFDVPDGFLAELRELAKLLEVNVKGFRETLQPGTASLYVKLSPGLANSKIPNPTPTIQAQIRLQLVKRAAEGSMAEWPIPAPTSLVLRDERPRFVAQEMWASLGWAQQSIVPVPNCHHLPLPPFGRLEVSCHLETLQARVLSGRSTASLSGRGIPGIRTQPR
ncbi:nucleolar protein 9 [Rhincodon typus]|uniref:nucleolar protein 9 n=1 Tax=Rhincodon typus TaxID=259920 RepID=UPI00202E36EC|nr:nucleolar protein 9 [Rhincodon typus]